MAWKFGRITAVRKCGGLKPYVVVVTCCGTHIGEKGSCGFDQKARPCWIQSRLLEFSPTVTTVHHGGHRRCKLVLQHETKGSFKPASTPHLDGPLDEVDNSGWKKKASSSWQKDALEKSNERFGSHTSSRTRQAHVKRVAALAERGEDAGSRTRNDPKIEIDILVGLCYWLVFIGPFASLFQLNPVSIVLLEMMREKKEGEENPNTQATSSREKFKKSARGMPAYLQGGSSDQNRLQLHMAVCRLLVFRHQSQLLYVMASSTPLTADRFSFINAKSRVSLSLVLVLFSDLSLSSSIRNCSYRSSDQVILGSNPNSFAGILDPLVLFGFAGLRKKIVGLWISEGEIWP
ncbi:hypothetical protein ACLOJK_033334 [Asimina triloba]